MIWTREKIIEILELSTNPTLQEVRDNYRKLVKKWHPDINKSPEAPEKMKLINRAYALATGKEQPRQQPPPPPPQYRVVINWGWGGGTTSYGTWTSGGSY